MIPITIRPGATTAARAGDRVRERLAHHPAAGSDDHEQERAVELREQPPPLLPGVLEVRHRLRDVPVDPSSGHPSPRVSTARPLHPLLFDLTGDFAGHETCQTGILPHSDVVSSSVSDESRIPIPCNPYRFRRDRQPGRQPRRTSAMSTDLTAGDRNLDGQSTPAARVEHLSEAERAEKGKAARAEVPRSAHADWEPPADRPSPVELLEEQAQTRVPELVPIRYGRMLVSPFTFYRGAAYLMASDLAGLPQDRSPDAALRRRASLQLRRLRGARPAARVQHQRLRRDASRPVRVGREATRRELRRRGSRPRLRRQAARGDQPRRRPRPTGRRSAGSPACATSTSGTRASTSRSCSPQFAASRDREGAQAGRGEPGEGADARTA